MAEKNGSLSYQAYCVETMKKAKTRPTLDRAIKDAKKLSYGHIAIIRNYKGRSVTVRYDSMENIRFKSVITQGVRG